MLPYILREFESLQRSCVSQVSSSALLWLRIVCFIDWNSGSFAIEHGWSFWIPAERIDLVLISESIACRFISLYPFNISIRATSGTWVCDVRIASGLSGFTTISWSACNIALQVPRFSHLHWSVSPEVWWREHMNPFIEAVEYVQPLV